MFDRGQLYCQVLSCTFKVPLGTSRYWSRGGRCMFDRGQAASVRRASSLIITPSPASQIKCSDGDDENAVVDASNKIFNAAVGAPEEASSDIACFLYGRCHRKAISANVEKSRKVLLWRKAISATVKLLLRLQPLPLAFPSLFNTQYLCLQIVAPKTSAKFSVNRVQLSNTNYYGLHLERIGGHLMGQYFFVYFKVHPTSSKYFQVLLSNSKYIQVHGLHLERIDCHLGGSIYRHLGIWAACSAYTIQVSRQGIQEHKVGLVK